MKFRSLLAVALASAMVLTAAGCGDDEDSAKEATPTTVRDTDESSKEADGPDGDTAADDDADSASDDPDRPVSSDDGSDTSIPGLGDFGQFGDCMNAGLAYAGLALSALGGSDGAKAAREAVSAMKSTLPKDLHDDLEVVAKAYATVAEKGIVEGGEVMDSKEFEKADDNISAYFDEVCATVGG